MVTGRASMVRPGRMRNQQTSETAESLGPCSVLLLHLGIEVGGLSPYSVVAACLRISESRISPTQWYKQGHCFVPLSTQKQKSELSYLLQYLG